MFSLVANSSLRNIHRCRKYFSLVFGILFSMRLGSGNARFHQWKYYSFIDEYVTVAKWYGKSLSASILRLFSIRYRSYALFLNMRVIYCVCFFLHMFTMCALDVTSSCNVGRVQGIPHWQRETFRQTATWMLRVQ